MCMCVCVYVCVCVCVEDIRIYSHRVFFASTGVHNDDVLQGTRQGTSMLTGVLLLRSNEELHTLGACLLI